MDIRAQTENGAGGNAAPEMLDKAGSTVQKVLDSTDRAADRAAETVKQATQRLRTGQERVAEAVQRATTAADGYKQRAMGLAQKPEEWVHSTSEYIQAQPFKSVAIAFVAGWIYGRFFR